MKFILLTLKDSEGPIYIPLDTIDIVYIDMDNPSCTTIRRREPCTIDTIRVRESPAEVIAKIAAVTDEARAVNLEPEL